MRWSPTSHHFFPVRFRRAAVAMLCVRHALNTRARVGADAGMSVVARDADDFKGDDEDAEKEFHAPVMKALDDTEDEEDDPADGNAEKIRKTDGNVIEQVR